MCALRALRGRLLLAAALVLLARPGAAAGEQSGVPLPAIPEGRGEQCVEPIPVIRRDHMVFLLHQRDETMHAGIRTKRHSLKECIDCHVSVDQHGRNIPIDAPGQFCDACHSYAGVSIDCFQCHAATPDSGRAPPSAAAGDFIDAQGGAAHAVSSGQGAMRAGLVSAGEDSQ